MKNRLFILIFTLYSITTFAQESYYRSPVDYPIFLAGNIGEIRSGHFHSGLDIKATNGIGSPIYAVADGDICRIGVSPTGYGNVLYISHPNGETSVYGHLNNFRSDIAQWVESRQNSARSFKVDLYPTKNQFKVKKGDIIAYLGNTGSSGGPHLHFEIRKSETNTPQNIVHQKIYEIKDDVKPTFYSVTLYECDTILGIPTFKATDNFAVNGKDKMTLNASKPFYLTYEVIDHKSGFQNTMGVYSLEQIVDSTTNFAFTIPYISFATSKYVQTFVEYHQQKSSKYHALRAYKSANNKLDYYSSVKNQGIITPKSNKEPILISTTIVDDNFNSTTLKFTVNSIADTSNTLDNTENLQRVIWNKEFNYNDLHLSVSIPKATLYDNTPLPLLSDINNNTFIIGNSQTPLAKSIYVNIFATTTDPELRHRALLQNVNNESIANTKYADGWYSATLTSLGSYKVVYDTLPPKITAQGLSNETLSFKVTDDLSGIEKYELRIDGKWVICAWDPKTKTMFHKLNNETKSSTESRTYQYTLTVEDYCGNVTQNKGTFKW